MRINAVLILVALTTINVSLAQTKTDTIQWLTESSFDLRTTNPDLKIEGIPFEKIFENVQMVLVGEATHGTKEFAEIKHRLFRYLVEELDFKYFFIEADFAAGLLVDQYISGYGGDPVEALKNLRYFHIVNKQGLALITWMKSFNETKKDASEKIRFFGIDCQSSENAFSQLKTYIRHVDSAFYKEIDGIKLTNHQPFSRTGILDKKYPTLTLSIDTVKILKDRLITNRVMYTEASSKMEYKIALRLVEVLLQSSEIIAGNYDYQKREESMAANVNWALNEIDPGSEKSFLWAHNAHVMYSEITEANTGKSFPTLGKLLKDTLNDKVYSIGMDFNKGSFIANEIRRDTIVKKVWTVEAAPANSFPSLLSKVRMAAMFIDFKSIPLENMSHWLNETAVKGHGIGGVFYPAYRLRRYTWPKNFDGLIFINETHEVTLDLD